MAHLTFSDGQNVDEEAIVDWCEDLNDTRGNEVVLLILSNGRAMTVPDKRANRRLLPDRTKRRSLSTFDDGRQANIDDLAEWVVGTVDWVGNRVIALFFAHANPMVVSDSAFNRALLPAPKMRDMPFN